jgi:hypothetical protein
MQVCNVFNAEHLRPVATPFYHLVPKDLAGNLLWRAAVRRRAIWDLDFRDAIRQACATDVLFFFAGFGWLVEPRGETPRILPFLPWVHQEPAILAMEAALGICEVGLEKSRGEGATWMVLWLFLRRWLFRKHSYFGLVSKDEEAVDAKGKPGALMNKLDWMLTTLPAWMLPRGFNPKEHRNQQVHTLINPELDCAFSGFAATGNVASGDRMTAMLMDELSKFAERKANADYHAMASTQAVTHSRFIVGTPWGSTGAYYDAMHDEASNMVKIILDWKDNPTKNRGLFRIDKEGRIENLNADHPLPEHYKKQLDKINTRLRQKGHEIFGVPRSPWSDNECLKQNATPKLIAQELNRDYGRSGDNYFDVGTIDLLREKQYRPALSQGAIKFDPEELFARYLPSKLGQVYLWLLLGIGNLPPERQYVAGADIAGGTGGDHSSNSALIILDRATGEQVLEYATPTVYPEHFAKQVVAICRWFNNAYLNWEINGNAGATFTKEVTQHHQYRNILYRRVEWDGSSSKISEKPATMTKSDDHKAAYLSDVVIAAQAGEIIIRSEATWKEFKEYGYKDGKIIHVRADRSESGAAKGKAHGDRAIAAAMALIALRDLGPRPKEERESVLDTTKLKRVPGHCIANRILDRMEEERQLEEALD